ncbi:PA1414 family protein [Phytopseudomonas dryadis]|nr:MULTISPECIES: PA1414 family protein [Pseudomonas]
MKAWFEALVAKLDAVLVPPMQPVPIRSEEQRRRAEEQRRRR